jgi:hypothetical protein
MQVLLKTEVLNLPKSIPVASETKMKTRTERDPLSPRYVPRELLINLICRVLCLKLNCVEQRENYLTCTAFFIFMQFFEPYPCCEFTGTGTSCSVNSLSVPRSGKFFFTAAVLTKKVGLRGKGIWGGGGEEGRWGVGCPYVIPQYLHSFHFCRR